MPLLIEHALYSWTASLPIGSHPSCWVTHLYISGISSFHHSQTPLFQLSHAPFGDTYIVTLLHTPQLCVVPLSGPYSIHPGLYPSHPAHGSSSDGITQAIPSLLVLFPASSLGSQLIFILRNGSSGPRGALHSQPSVVGV